MTIFGVLYHDDTHKLSEIEMIELARKIFEKKCSSKATLALLSIRSEKAPEVEGLLVTRSHLVFSNHTIVGVALPNPPATIQRS